MTTTSADVRRDQVRGQPGDRLDVEVVGRLVEDQQVGVVQQQPGQRAPAPLAAGEPVHGAVEGDAGEQHLDHLAGARVGRPLVVRLAGEHHLADGVAVVEQVALVEVAEVQPPDWETRPLSGSRPASRRSRVVLPSPLRPTTPMRSPTPTPRLTSSRSTRTP